MQYQTTFFFCICTIMMIIFTVFFGTIYGIVELSHHIDNDYIKWLASSLSRIDSNIGSFVVLSFTCATFFIGYIMSMSYVYGRSAFSRDTFDMFALPALNQKRAVRSILYGVCIVLLTNLSSRAVFQLAGVDSCDLSHLVKPCQLFDILGSPNFDYSFFFVAIILGFFWEHRFDFEFHCFAGYIQFNRSRVHSERVRYNARTGTVDFSMH